MYRHDDRERHEGGIAASVPDVPGSIGDRTVPAYENAEGEAPPKRVLIFGFSVTALPGYVSSLRALLGERRVVIESRGIGGINIGSVPYLHTVLEYERYDHVFFEVTTCHRYSEQAPEVYGETLARIVAQVRDRGAEPAFLHLYREGVDHDDDRLLAAAASLCSEAKVPYLDLVPPMIEFRTKGLLSRYLRDGVHTTGAGAEFYARAMLPFLDRVLDDGRAPRTAGGKDAHPTHATVPVDRLFAAEAIGTFERGNVTMPLVEIPANTSRRFDVPAGYSFEGFLYLRGPRAGIMEVEIEDRVALRLAAFDQHSYYRRYSTWSSSCGTTSAVTVRQLPDEPEIRLLKGEPDPGPRVGEICGLFVSAL